MTAPDVEPLWEDVCREAYASGVTREIDVKSAREMAPARMRLENMFIPYVKSVSLYLYASKKLAIPTVTRETVGMSFDAKGRVPRRESRVTAFCYVGW